MIIAVGGLKGGIGKTLVSIHLAGEALARGKTTLLADADVQRSTLTWADIAAEGKREAPTVIGVSTSLRQNIPPLAAQYDLTIIDCPPRGDVMSRTAMFIADVVLLPTGPAPTDFWALAGTVELVREAQAIRPELQAFLLLNRMQPRQGLSGSAREALASLELPILETTLGMRTPFAESLALGMTVSTHSPSSRAADEIRALCDELLGAAVSKKAKKGVRRG